LHILAPSVLDSEVEPPSRRELWTSVRLYTVRLSRTARLPAWKLSALSVLVRAIGRGPGRAPRAGDRLRTGPRLAGRRQAAIAGLDADGALGAGDLVQLVHLRGEPSANTVERPGGPRREKRRGDRRGGGYEGTCRRKRCGGGGDDACRRAYTVIQRPVSETGVYSGWRGFSRRASRERSMARQRSGEGRTLFLSSRMARSWICRAGRRTRISDGADTSQQAHVLVKDGGRGSATTSDTPAST
jgi:hypothetical protein